MQQSQRTEDVLQGRSLCAAPQKVPLAGASRSQPWEWLPACNEPASTPAASNPDSIGTVAKGEKGKVPACQPQSKVFPDKAHLSFAEGPAELPEDAAAGIGHCWGELAGRRGVLGTADGCYPCDVCAGQQHQHIQVQLKPHQQAASGTPPVTPCPAHPRDHRSGTQHRVGAKGSRTQLRWGR